PDGPWSQPQDKCLPEEDDHVEGHGAAGNVPLPLRRPPEAERQLRGQLHFIEPEHEYLFGRMHVDAHAYSKAEGQRLIGSLVARKRLGTQLEMLDALATSGCHVTQATISRDIRELGLEKSRDPLGRPRYAQPQRARRADPGQALAAVLSQFGRRA